MQLNSLYTTHDMRLSNILQQYDYTFSYYICCILDTDTEIVYNTGNDFKSYSRSLAASSFARSPVLTVFTYFQTINS